MKEEIESVTFIAFVLFFFKVTDAQEEGYVNDFWVDYKRTYKTSIVFLQMTVYAPGYCPCNLIFLSHIYELFKISNFLLIPTSIEWAQIIWWRSNEWVVVTFYGYAQMVLVDSRDTLP